MIFRLPHQPIEFEIPNEWWLVTEMSGWKPSAVSYVATSDPNYPTTIIPLLEVAAPVRGARVAWFQKERMVQVLRGFRTGEAVPPIEVDEPPTTTKFRYRVRDGFHRFYASAAVGFTHLPVLVKPYLDINAL